MQEALVMVASWLLGALSLPPGAEPRLLPPSGCGLFVPGAISSPLDHRFLETELRAVCPPEDSNGTPHWARFCRGCAGCPPPERRQDARVLPGLVGRW